MEKMIIIGNGGHARSLTDTLERAGKYEIAGYIVNSADEQRKDTRYPIIGQDDDLEKIFKYGIKYAAVGIGYLGKGDVRKRLWYMLKKIGFSLPVICDPTAIMARDIKLGEGNFIGKGAVINSGAVIGRMCIINTNAVVEHDCLIGSFSHVAVGGILCGGVNVGEDTFIGANATVIQGIKIGRGCIIGAGVTVRKDVKDNFLVAEDKKNMFSYLD